MSRLFLPVIGAAAVFLAGAVHADPGWARTAGLDFWNLADEKAVLAAELAQYERLEAEKDHSFRLFAANDRIVDRLVNGQLPLAQAVEEWMALNWQREGLIVACRFHFPDATTDRELAARQLIRRVETALLNLNKPCHSAEVSPRLHGELRAMNRVDSASASP